MRSICAELALGVFSLVLLGADSPFSGTWKLNLAKSKLPTPAPQSLTVVVVADDININVSEEGTEENGKPIKESFDAKFDGKDYPITGSTEADTIAVQRVNPRTLKTTSKKNGKVVGNNTVVVAPDGKITTVEFSHNEADGKKTMGTAVYDRQ